MPQVSLVLTTSLCKLHLPSITALCERHRIGGASRDPGTCALSNGRATGSSLAGPAISGVSHAPLHAPLGIHLGQGTRDVGYCATLTANAPFLVSSGRAWMRARGTSSQPPFVRKESPRDDAASSRSSMDAYRPVLLSTYQPLLSIGTCIVACLQDVAMSHRKQC